MQEPAPLERLELPRRHAHLPPDVDRDRAHPLRMLARERVALVHRLGQRPDRLREHLAHLDEPLVRHPRREQRQPEQQRRPPATTGQFVHPSHEPAERGEGEQVGPDARRLRSPEELTNWPPAPKEHDERHKDQVQEEIDERAEQGRGQLLRRLAASPQGVDHDAAEDDRQDDRGVIRECPVPGDPAPELAAIGAPDERHPRSSGRSAQDRGGHQRSGGDNDLHAVAQANRKRGRHDRYDRPKQQPRCDLRAAGARIGVQLDRNGGPDRKHKAREQQRTSRCSHEQCDVCREGPSQIASPDWTDGPRTLRPNVRVPHGLAVLEALESRPSGECCCGDGAQSDRQPHDAVLHARSP